MNQCCKKFNNLHLKAVDCYSPPDWRLLVFDLLMIARSQAEWLNEHWRCAQNCSKKLADTEITKCIVHMNKKQTIPQIWKYWATSTIEWNWKTSWVSWTKILSINSASYGCLVLLYQFWIHHSDIELLSWSSARSLTILQKSFQRCCEIEWSNWHLRCAHTRNQHWIVHINKKETSPQIWKYCITSTMVLH